MKASRNKRAEKIPGRLIAVQPGMESVGSDGGQYLRRYGIQPAAKGSTNMKWKDFIAADMAVLAGVDFVSVEVMTWRGLTTY
jgi:hypothetical protein